MPAAVTWSEQPHSEQMEFNWSIVFVLNTIDFLCTELVYKNMWIIHYQLTADTNKGVALRQIYHVFIYYNYYQFFICLYKNNDDALNFSPRYLIYNMIRRQYSFVSMLQHSNKQFPCILIKPYVFVLLFSPSMNTVYRAKMDECQNELLQLFTVCNKWLLPSILLPHFHFRPYKRLMKTKWNRFL